MGGVLVGGEARGGRGLSRDGAERVMAFPYAALPSGAETETELETVRPVDPG